MGHALGRTVHDDVNIVAPVNIAQGDQHGRPVRTESADGWNASGGVDVDRREDRDERWVERFHGL
jgi:hypothetical protein